MDLVMARAAKVTFNVRPLLVTTRSGRRRVFQCWETLSTSLHGQTTWIRAANICDELRRNKTRYQILFCFHTVALIFRFSIFQNLSQQFHFASPWLKIYPYLSIRLLLPLGQQSLEEFVSCMLNIAPGGSGLECSEPVASRAYCWKEIVNARILSYTESMCQLKS